MATKNFRSTVLEPTSEFAHGDKLRFTALATVGEVLKGSFSETTIGEDGVYSVDLQYGKHRIDYKPYEGVWRHFADVEVNADTLATTLQDLALASVPVTDDAVLVLQGILSDAEAAKTAAEAAEAAAETALASIDSTVAEVSSGYPSLLAAQLSKTVVVNAATGDDTTADGSSDKPYKTIKTAIESQPDLIKINVMLEGGNDKSSAHLINSMILYKSRSVTLTFNNNHVVLSDAIAIVFAGEAGGRFVISDAGGGANIHVNTAKILFSASSEAQVHIGGTSGVNFYVSDDAPIDFLVTGVVSVRGVSKLTTSNVSMLNASGSAPATASVTAVSTTGGASVLVNHSRASMGSSYSDGASSQTVTLINSTKLVSM